MAYGLLVSALAAVLTVCAGCSTEHYKEQADEEVYSIIDNKWAQQFGPQANYHIADVPASPNDINAPAKLPEQKAVSLAEAVAMATANNRDYQRQKEDLYLSALDLTLERHAFNPQFFGIFSGDYTRADRTSTGRSSDEEQLTAGGEAGFSQLLADGATISTSIALDWARFLTGDPDRSLGSVLSATVRQPLLRGAGRKIVQENLTQAERNTLYELRRFARYRKTFVVSVVSQYYRVLQALDGVTNARNNYETLIRAEERVKMLADAGRLPPFQVDQAEQDKLRAWDGYVAAQQRYKQALDDFKITLGLPAEIELQLQQQELDALSAAEVADPNFPVDEAVDTALVCRLDLVTSADTVADARRKVDVAADGLGADLDLVGSLSVDSRPRTHFEELQFHRGDYALGLELDLPLERKAERNAYREALITLIRRSREYDLARDEVKLDVRQAYRQLEEAAASYQIRSKSLQLAETRVDSTSMLLQAGRATTRDLLESQDALLRAQNEKTAALIDYTVAKLSFFRDVGLLQIRPDGMYSGTEYEWAKQNTQ